jgi:FMN phosphatase YigB (HAD superfamily)
MLKPFSISTDVAACEPNEVTFVGDNDINVVAAGPMGMQSRPSGG